MPKLSSTWTRNYPTCTSQNGRGKFSFSHPEDTLIEDLEETCIVSNETKNPSPDIKKIQNISYPTLNSYAMQVETIPLSFYTYEKRVTISSFQFPKGNTPKNLTNLLTEKGFKPVP